MHSKLGLPLQRAQQQTNFIYPRAALKISNGMVQDGSFVTIYKSHFHSGLEHRCLQYHNMDPSGNVPQYDAFPRKLLGKSPN